MNRFVTLRVGAVVFLGLTAGWKADAAAASATGVQLTQLEDRIRVEIGGKLFTEYHFKDVPRPFFYPVMGPGDQLMTRHWPMETTPGEEHDHPHHRSLWFAHGELNGIDFWSEAKGFGKIVHQGFDELQSGQHEGVIRSHDSWVSAEGKEICADERVFRVFASGPGGGRLFDFEITLHASEGELTFGDTKEGSMAMRIAESMRLKGGGSAGHIVNSEGLRDGATWGKRADWCDYYGPVDGQVVGIAIFDHPLNPRHPTWWHVRDYGLFAANPFGKHDFEALKDKTAGDLVVPAGQSITFRYRFYLHAGDEKMAQVAEAYRAYSKSGPQAK
jgi:hypothetical protein